MLKSKLHFFIIYLVWFFACWTGYVFFIYPRVVAAFSTDSLMTALIGVLVRLILWILPIYLYLAKIDKAKPLKYLKLDVFSRRAMLLTVLGVVGYAAVYFVKFGAPDLAHLNITWVSIIGIALTVGIFEETVFRGFILQKLAEHMNFWLADVVAAALFTLIHFPGWFGIGLNQNISIVEIAAVFLLGLIMGALLRWGKSLWPAILVHQLNDIFAVIVWG